MPTITGSRVCCAASLVGALELSGARSGWLPGWPERETRRGSNNCPTVSVTTVFKPVSSEVKPVVFWSHGYQNGSTWYARETTSYFPLDCDNYHDPYPPASWAVDVCRVADNPCAGTTCYTQTEGARASLAPEWLDKVVVSNETTEFREKSGSACPGLVRARRVLSGPIAGVGGGAWNYVCGGPYVPPAELQVDLTLSDSGRDAAASEWLAFDAVGEVVGGDGKKYPYVWRRDSRIAWKFTAAPPACALAGKLGTKAVKVWFLYLVGEVKMNNPMSGATVAFTGTQSVVQHEVPATLDLEGGVVITETFSLSPSPGQGMQLFTWWVSNA